jgi:hypothetical protein
VIRRSLLALALLSAGAAACAKTAPVVPVDIALAMPAPPARLLIPVELPEYVELVPELVVEASPPPSPPRPPQVSRQTEKPAAPAPPPVEAPPPVLQPTTTTTRLTELEQRIAGLIASAEQRLKGVNFRELGVQARAHFGQARDFIRMANDALRNRNYVYAESLATKANTVAGLLPRG